MTNNVTKEFLQEHFRKQYNLVLKGSGFKGTFKTYDELTDFYRKRRLCLKPVITA